MGGNCSSRSESPPENRNRSSKMIGNQVRLQEFTYQKLVEATGGWRLSHWLGATAASGGDEGEIFKAKIHSGGCGGGLGEFYKVKIQNRKVVIKKLEAPIEDEEFLAEIRTLAALKHKNLVKLVGYCCEDLDKFVVSEYIPNRSLYYHLHQKEKKKTTLCWSNRFKIAIGSAKALNYLHQACIIHRRIKGKNILLDYDFSPKLSDSGLGRLFVQSDCITRESVRKRGTSVYIDPDKQEEVSDKSDVYSFGVILLELISGRKPFFRSLNIVEWAKPLIRQALGHEKDITLLIDRKMVAKWSQKEIQQHKSEIEIMICCAAASVYKPSKDRPQMKQIVQALEKKIPLSKIWDVNKDSVFLEPSEIYEAPTLLGGSSGGVGLAGHGDSSGTRPDSHRTRQRRVRFAPDTAEASPIRTGHGRGSDSLNLTLKFWTRKGHFMTWRIKRKKKWWRELNLIENLDHVRDRIVESYFWAVGSQFQPQFGLSRIMMAKYTAMVTVADDTYDSFAQVDQLERFTAAIQRI